MREVDFVHGRRGDPGIALPRLFPRPGTAAGVDGNKPFSGQFHPFVAGKSRSHESAAGVHLRPRGGAPPPRFAPDDDFRREHVPPGGKDALVFVVKVMVEIAAQGTAARSLRETGVPISEIVKDVRFAGEYMFYRRFRQKYGMTPGEYRRLNS